MNANNCVCVCVSDPLHKTAQFTALLLIWKAFYRFITKPSSKPQQFRALFFLLHFICHAIPKMYDQGIAKFMPFHSDLPTVIIKKQNYMLRFIFHVAIA